MNRTEYSKKITSAKKLLAAGRFVESLEILQNLYNIFPDNEEVLIYLACALLENGKPVQAFDLANQAVDLRPDLMYLKNLRGHLFIRMGLNEGAVSDLLEYTGKLSGEHKTSAINLIRALAGANKFKEADEMANKLIEKYDWEELFRLKDFISYAFEIEKKKDSTSKSRIEKNINLSRDAFELNEYWFSKFASELIEKNDSVKSDQKKDAVIILIESFLRLYQVKPALKTAEIYYEDYKDDFSFKKIYNDLLEMNYQLESSEVYYDNNVTSSAAIETNDFRSFPSETLQVNSTKFFDAVADSKVNERIYYKQFSVYSTKYIGIEIIFKNKFYKLRKRNYKGFAVWYQNDFEIGRSYFKLNINENWDSVIYVQTWGSDEHFYWEKGTGKVELYIEDFRVSESLFFIGDEKIELQEIDNKKRKGQTAITGEESLNKTKVTSSEEDKLDDLIKELNNYVGLTGIKNSIQEFIDYLEFIKERKKLGLKVQEGISLNSIFLGNPGTGKTTIARLMAKIFKAMGLLPENKLIEVDRASLVGQYIGETAQKTEKVIESAIGGVLFIDEAYSLSKKGNTQDFGREAIDVLMKRMEDRKGEFAVIVAGYPEEMDEFLNSNPGIKSRFSHTFEFNDYSPADLVEIVCKLASEEDYSFERNAVELLEKEFTGIYRKRDKTFGNARLARKVFEEAKIQVGKRYLSKQGDISKESLSLIIAEDISEILNKQDKKSVAIPIDEEALSLVLKEFNKLIGMESIKNEINDVVKLARFYAERGENIKDKFSSHILFLGNPGTGKTTVARLFSRLYSALGILEKGHLLETDREGLVAGYVGQTAIKAKNIINKALGGTLFIDEAYALSDGRNSNDFGKEAIDILLKKMEDERGKFLVIAAGYNEEMKLFVNSNPGLKSRFNKILNFDDYTPEEMLKIADNIFTEFNIAIDENAKDLLLKYFGFLYSKRNRHFGNARVIKSICEEIKKQALLRAADTMHDSEVITITEKDISKVYSGENYSTRNDENDVEKILEEINILPGLKNVKRSIDKLVSSLRITAMRKQKGLKNISKPMHCVFTGNPGSGKSTVADFVGKILKQMKYLSGGEVVNIKNIDIIRNNKLDVKLLQDQLQNRRGSVIYISDVSPYNNLTEEDAREFLQTIFHYSELNNCLVIIAGKQEIVSSFTGKYQDFTHRFTNYFTFDDYSPRDLLEITAYIAEANGYILDEGALQQLLDIFTEIYNHRENTFTNAFVAQKILNLAIIKQEERIAENNITDENELNLILLEDIQKIENVV